MILETVSERAVRAWGGSIWLALAGALFLFLLSAALIPFVLGRGRKEE